MKIAVTTTDGVKVNQHFGKAEKFYIYELSVNCIKFIEIKYVNSYCDNIDGERVDPGHKYSVDKLSLVYKPISDCEVIYTQQIGEKPLKGLIEKGIAVKICSCAVQSIVGCSGKCK